MAKHKPITLGCDPELFLVDRNGNAIPSCGLIGGTKDVPRLLREEGGIRVLEDNVTLEFNINPVTNSDDLLVNVGRALDVIINDILRDQQLSFCWEQDSMMFPEELLQSEQARMFGCDPDFEAFKQGTKRKPPTPELLKNVRCAGGHVHLGYDVENCGVPVWAIVQFLDAMATLQYRAHFNAESVRRKYYGLPGLYRPKEYGLEYRTPNNSWLSNTGGLNYIRSMHLTVAGVIADPARARAMYDLINWKQVYNALHNSTWGSKMLNIEQAAVNDMRHELHDIGARYLEAVA